MATNMEVPHIEEVAYVPNAPTSPPTYSDAFPELPVPAPRPATDAPVTEPTRPWPANNKFLMRSSTCTQVCVGYDPSIQIKLLCSRIHFK